MKYNFLTFVRDKATMFWMLAFPIFLMTILISALPSGDYKVNIKAYISPENPAAEYMNFSDMFDFKIEDDYKEALKNGDIDGYIDKESNLIIAKNGFKQTMLKTILDNMKRIEKDPETVMTVVGEEFIQKDVQGFEFKKSFFYAVLAMISYMAMYGGVSVVESYQANITPAAMRFQISPTPKIKGVLNDFVVMMFFEFFTLTVSIIYVKYVLGVNAIENYTLTYLIFIIGSIFSFSLGLMTVYLGNISSNARGAITQSSMMLLSGAAGLYGTFFRNIFDNLLGKVANYNPAKIVSDSIYKANILGGIDDMKPYLIGMVVVSVVFIMLSVLKMKENRYDSI